MDTDTLIGIISGSAALSIILVLVFWSRGAINRIADSGPRSARAILRGARRER